MLVKMPQIISVPLHGRFGAAFHRKALFTRLQRSELSPRGGPNGPDDRAV